MTTENGNKLIAEFEGYTAEPFANDGGAGFTIRTPHYSVSRFGTEEEVKSEVFSWGHEYHSSWDWLMPVVKKIHEINTVGIAMHYEIDKQWNVVVSFIQWYTQLKPGVSPE